MSQKICPECGAAQPWEMWRRCACGYDFGPGERREPDSIPKQAPSESQRWLKLRHAIEQLPLSKAEQKRAAALCAPVDSNVLLGGWVSLLLGLSWSGLSFNGYQSAQEFRHKTELVSLRNLSDEEAARQIARDKSETIPAFEAHIYLDATERFYLGAAITLLVWGRSASSTCCARSVAS